jgi:ATP-binding cassette subfamily C protein
MATCESAFWALKNRIREAEEKKEPDLGSKPVSFNKSLRFDQVGFSYGQSPVLDAVSLEIPAGSFAAVIGPSGAGKTTLVDLVIGLLRPQKGEVIIDDVPMAEMDLKYWRSHIGYVPQDTVLLHDTIMANVTLSDPDLSPSDVEEALRAAGALDFVQAMPDGVKTIVGERGAKLSGGQRQRIAIARALATRPSLLILDEATTALDPESEQAICRTLARLRGKITILAISHQPALVNVADWVYRIQEKSVSINTPESETASGDCQIKAAN